MYNVRERWPNECQDNEITNWSKGESMKSTRE